MKDLLKKIIAEFVDYILAKNNGYKIDQLKRKESLIVGEHTYGEYNLIIDNYKGSEAKVFIGKFCSIGPNVRIITGGIHPVDWVSTFPFKARWDLKGKYEDGMPSTKGDVVIENDVWIGTNVVILSGVKIGNGVVVASSSVITKDVPSYSIVAGNPARVIRSRFEEKDILKLNELCWWNWDKEQILANSDLLSSKNLNTFLRKNK